MLVLLSVQERQAAVTMGRRMLPVMGGKVVGQVGHDYLDPAIKNGHFGEGLYRTVVGLASVSQEIRVGSIKKTHFADSAFGSRFSPSAERSGFSGGSVAPIYGSLCAPAARRILGQRARGVRREFRRHGRRDEWGGVEVGKGRSQAVLLLAERAR